MRVEVNVFVSTMSAPAARYSAWISWITSGRDRFRMSLFPFRSLAVPCSRSPR
jgi:hypothetical protein